MNGAPPLGESVVKSPPIKNLAVRLDDDDVNRAVGVRIEAVERGLRAHFDSAQKQQEQQRRYSQQY